ncbi:hypothetical protein ACTFIZ_012892 [Dictyostelium cf. discoideum]
MTQNRIKLSERSSTTKPGDIRISSQRSLKERYSKNSTRNSQQIIESTTCRHIVNTLGVNKVAAVPPTMVSQQIDSVLSDIGTHAIKTGMLGSVEIVKAIAQSLNKYA